MSELNKELEDKKVTEYLPIDHLNEGLGYVKPSENEYFLYQSEYMGDRMDVWITVRLKTNGKVLRLVNPKDLSEIHFESIP